MVLMTSIISKKDSIISGAVKLRKVESSPDIKPANEPSKTHPFDGEAL